VGEGSYEVAGNLTLHGVTRPVTAKVEHVGAGKDPRSGKSLLGFDAVVTVARSEFDMKSLMGPVGDEVDIHVALQLVGR
jgi:polyisoprenoid-binding protein YceI